MSSQHCFHVITDGEMNEDNTAVVVRAISGIADYIHIRKKHLSARDLYGMGTTWMAQGLDANKIIVNDRIDVANALNAAGVQLAYHSLPLAAAKKAVKPGILLGCSVHSAAEAKVAEIHGADYVLFGHIFPSESKPTLPPRGIEALTEVVQSVSLPVIAVGGITPDLTEQVLSSGCAGIAVISAVMASRKPQETARAFTRILSAWKLPPHVAWPQTHLTESREKRNEKNV